MEQICKKCGGKVVWFSDTDLLNSKEEITKVQTNFICLSCGKKSKETNKI